MALMAFAGNSVLCRLALGEQAIDAAGFTVIRLLSGIVVLMVIIKLTQPAAFNLKRSITKVNASLTGLKAVKQHWLAPLALFIYAVTFSFAYITLETATGALVLFGMVQLTMIIASLMTGKRLQKLEWLGVMIAFIGLIYLMLPELTTPSLLGFVLMAISGVAWGVYTLAGKGSQKPIQDTCTNFMQTLPFVLLLILFAYPFFNLSAQGVLLAVLSGGIASGVGYSIWYSAVRYITSLQAAVLQLLVPIIAALGGVVFVSEPITLRMLVAAGLILGGIMLVSYASASDSYRTQ
ncbi:EamA family transporter [Saccharobesus litoralis]|uniref:EamA family transporter n=1 Tax=Saccharobesus litoralis TaxID=2172099 RepID=A0A2S0VXQ2_9ALTE|nr:EamA family transporter [Saccharobesus litoralis]